MSPDFEDEHWHWPRPSVRLDNHGLAATLSPPPSATPLPGRSHPLAATFVLRQDPSFLRGFRYGTPFIACEKDILREQLKHVDAPDQVKPYFENGAFHWDALPGMIQLIPGVPFTYEMQSGAVLTVACLHTPTSLREYGPDGNTVISHLDWLYRMTFGHDTDPDTSSELRVTPIYQIPGLKRNLRSGDRIPNRYDGSYSLASTVGEGEGAGCFMPAIQNDTKEARAQVGAVLKVLHDVWTLVLPRTVSKFEYEMVNFDADDNNTFSFGGLGQGPTSLQLNISSYGESFSDSIGWQSSWHTDVHDAITHWTMVVMLLRIPAGSDPGPFLLGRPGLYVREKNVLQVIFFFKGNDIHTGFPPSVSPEQWTDYIAILSNIYDTTDATNRAVYVCYPSSIGIERRQNMSICPATHFGNANVTLAHKVAQRTFATHGMHILGGPAPFANRLGREAFYAFFNTLKHAGLHLRLDPDEVLQAITYTNDQGLEVPLQPAPVGFHPVKDASKLRIMRSYYRWYATECARIHILMHKREYRRLVAGSADKEASCQVIRSSRPLPTALQPGISLDLAIDSGQANSQTISDGNDSDARQNQVVEHLPLTEPLEARLISAPTGDEALRNSAHLTQRSHEKRKTTSQATRQSKRLRQMPTEAHLDEDDIQTCSVDGEEYAVEAIIGFRQHVTEPEWLVHWEGYDSTQDEWRPWGSLQNCAELVQKYNQIHGIAFTPPTIPTEAPQAYSLQTVAMIRRLFSVDNLRDELSELQAYHHQSKEPTWYYKALPRHSLSSVASSLVIRIDGNSLYGSAFATLPSSSPAMVDAIFAQLQLVSTSLPEASGSLKMMNVLQRSQIFDLCRSLRVIHHWIAVLGPAVAEHLLHNFIQGNLVDGSSYMLLAQLVVSYVKEHQRSTTGHNMTTRPPQAKTSRVIRADQYASLGLTPPPATARQRPPSQIHLLAISKTVPKDERAMLKVCQKVLTALWTSYYIEPYVCLMDKVISGSTKNTTGTDYTARAICRGAVLSCIVDAFGTENILYSKSVMAFIQVPWIVFGPSGDGYRAPRYADKCVKQANTLFAPLFQMIASEMITSVESQAIVDEMADILHAQLLSIENGMPLDEDFSIDMPTLNGQDSDAYETQRPVSWGSITSSSLVPTTSRIDMFRPLALMLREAFNKQRLMAAGDDSLRQVLDGHHVTTTRVVPFDPDLTNPIRQFSMSSNLFRSHLSPSHLTSAYGLSNLLAWLGTGQGYQTREFLGKISFFSTNVEDIVQKFDVVMTQNHAVFLNSSYKQGQSIRQMPGYTALDNPRIWGQYCHQLSCLSHKTSDMSQTAALRAKFSLYFSTTIISTWQAFLGPLLDQDPETFSGPRRSWEDTLHLVAKLGIPGFKNGLTTLQSANLLAFANIVTAPAPMAVGSWIFNHKDLGAFRGMKRLGFEVKDITSVVTAFLIVHDHLDHHLTEEDKAIFGFSNGLSGIAVEHLLCKVARWEHRLSWGHLNWGNYDINTPWVAGENYTDPTKFPIPFTPSDKLIDDKVEQIMRVIRHS